jgi:diguanylate cyclase (GGDEF)-like protein
MDEPLTIKRISNPARKMTFTYLVSLTLIAGLSIFVHFTLNKIIVEQKMSAKLLNVSGEQRMLSQRIALYTSEFIAQGSPSDKKQALAALSKMQSNHRYLLQRHFDALEQKQSSPMSTSMYALYFSAPHELDRKVTEFSSLISQALDRSSVIIVSQNSLEGLTFLPLAKDQMLTSFNATVEQYEMQSNQKIQELRTTQQLILIIIILTVLVEGLFVIRPLLAKSDRYSKNLQEEANHDYLTNLLNRRSFNVLVKQSIAMSKRYNSNLSVISFDIDHFKSVNDQYGHNLGDNVIQNVANIIQVSCRDSDSVFRFGGEEFLILLPRTSLSEALMLAEKIRKSIANSPVFADKLIIEITASGGVAEWDSQEIDIKSTLQRADKALYQAKEQGRDRIISG